MAWRRWSELYVVVTCRMTIFSYQILCALGRAWNNAAISTVLRSPYAGVNAKTNKAKLLVFTIQVMAAFQSAMFDNKLVRSLALRLIYSYRIPRTILWVILATYKMTFELKVTWKELFTKIEKTKEILLVDKGRMVKDGEGDLEKIRWEDCDVVPLNKVLIAHDIRTIRDLHHYIMNSLILLYRSQSYVLIFLTVHVLSFC